MKKMFTAMVLMLMVGATANAYENFTSSERDNYSNSYNERRNTQNNTYRRRSSSRNNYITIKVESSEPIYKNITTRIPQEECWNEEVAVRSNNSSTNPLGVLIGGVAGGILGNQVGGGRGKTAATVGGALIGTMVGNNLSKNNVENGRNYTTQRRCKKTYASSTENKLVGYKNIGYINGQRVEKISKQPRETLRVKVSYSVY